MNMTPQFTFMTIYDYKHLELLLQELDVVLLLDSDLTFTEHPLF